MPETKIDILALDRVILDYLASVGCNHADYVVVVSDLSSHQAVIGTNIVAVGGPELLLLTAIKVMQRDPDIELDLGIIGETKGNA